MFTCISCKVAFETADEQRSHFATDWHRYNMKRRVADLPPLPAASFNEKVLERREQNAIRTDPRSLTCTACSKAFATENAFRSHVQSKRHRDREAYLAKRAHTDAKEPADDSNKGQVDEGDSEEDEADDKTDDGTEDEEDIEARLATYRRRIRPSDCLFCPTRTASPEDAVAHMSRSHGFFIPDRDHLLDLPGLLSYLGEKIIIGNLCLFCPNGGKEFGSVDAVRRHMTDKGHCKMAYESNEDRAEVVDFYDHEVIDEEWEDMEDAEGDVEGDVIDMPGEVSLAADGLSLVLPSGRILGHRSLKLYYDQNFRPIADRKPVDDKVKRVREKLADPTQALVPVAGGSGGFGRGLQVMKARNAGEAKWAKKQGRSFTEQRRRTDHATRVGFVHNNQKHFRDPLLQ